MIPIFDGHNDVLARLWLNDHTADDFLNTTLAGQMDLARCRQGGFVGGLFAVFVPPISYLEKNYPKKLEQTLHDIVFSQVATLLKIANQKQAKLCTSVADIQHCIDHNILAMVMHFEGADVIDERFDLLEVLYATGLRSVGALWNNPNQFGHGLQADFPHSPDIGDGLTILGKKFIRRCAEKNMVVDVSHMNEKAFWDTAKILQQPIVATHSNVHKLCPQARNLTDQQLVEIKNTQGFVGVNFDTAFLRSDGKRNANTTLSTLIEHIDYLLNILGEDGVGFGSDYDGGFMSEHWATVAQLPNIINALKQAGYSQDLIEKICYKNWLRVLERIWTA